MTLLMKTKLLLLAALLAVSSAAIRPAYAQTGYEEVSRLSIVPGWQREDGLYIAAVRIELAPGWKTYWRAPGNNGIAPIFDWSASENLAQVGYFWPSPRIIDQDGVRTIGYEEQLVLPVLLRARDPEAPMTLRLDLDYGICDDICLPAKESASLSPDMDEVFNKEAIEAAIAERARPAASLGLTTSQCQLTPQDNAFVLNAQFDFETEIEAHRLVILETGSQMIWASATDHAIDGRTLTVEADLMYFGEGAMTLDRSALRFTMMNDGQSIEITGCSGG